jgi:hypothetical protein
MSHAQNRDVQLARGKLFMRRPLKAQSIYHWLTAPEELLMAWINNNSIEHNSIEPESDHENESAAPFPSHIHA